MINAPDLALNETHRMVRDTVSSFAAQHILPIAQDIDKSGEFPRYLWPKLGALGLHGVTVPLDQGGSGMGYLAHAIVMEEISRASGSVGLSYGAHSNLCINQIARYASPEQLSRYLPALLSGEHIGALAMSEAGAGSDVLNMQTTAVEHEDHFLLNGHKMWITNGPGADVIVVYAKTNPEAGKQGISAFAVTPDLPGFECGQKIDKLGMRASDTCELIFKNCKVPKERLLGKRGEGVRILMSGLNYERVILAAGPLGLMQACLDLVLPYVHERKQFGKAIGEFQLIQAKVADMYVALNTARSFVYAIARSCDSGTITNKDAAAAILYASEQATQMALQTIQILGGNGYTNEYAAGRLLRDAKLYEIGAGTSEIRRLIIARELFNETT